MSIPDIINGAYEMLGGLFLLLNCKRVLKDKSVKGVSMVPTIFFATWGAWNLYYYAVLGQWVSWCGGISVLTVNIVWIALMFKYRKN